MNSRSKNGHRLFFVIIVYNLFSSEEILKNHAEGCLKINGTQNVKCLVRLKIYFS